MQNKTPISYESFLRKIKNNKDWSGKVNYNGEILDGHCENLIGVLSGEKGKIIINLKRYVKNLN